MCLINEISDECSYLNFNSQKNLPPSSFIHAPEKVASSEYNATMIIVTKKSTKFICLFLKHK